MPVVMTPQAPRPANVVTTDDLIRAAEDKERAEEAAKLVAAEPANDITEKEPTDATDTKDTGGKAATKKRV